MRNGIYACHLTQIIYVLTSFSSVKLFTVSIYMDGTDSAIAICFFNWPFNHKSWHIYVAVVILMTLQFRIPRWVELIWILSMFGSVQYQDKTGGKLSIIVWDTLHCSIIMRFYTEMIPPWVVQNFKTIGQFKQVIMDERDFTRFQLKLDFVGTYYIDTVLCNAVELILMRLKMLSKIYPQMNTDIVKPYFCNP